MSIPIQPPTREGQPQYRSLILTQITMSKKKKLSAVMINSSCFSNTQYINLSKLKMVDHIRILWAASESTIEVLKSFNSKCHVFSVIL